MVDFKPLPRAAVDAPCPGGLRHALDYGSPSGRAIEVMVRTRRVGKHPGSRKPTGHHLVVSLPAPDLMLFAVPLVALNKLPATRILTEVHLQI